MRFSRWFHRTTRDLRAWMLSGSVLGTAVWMTLFATTADARGAVGDTTVTTLSADMISAYIADKTLMIAEKKIVMNQLADQARLEKRSSKTFQYTRYERLALPSAPLTEGTTPAATPMSVSTVTATVDQWGQVVVLTDLVELVIKHPVLAKATERLATAAAELRDRELQETLLAGTNVQYAASRTSRATLTATDYLVTADIRKAVANLRNNGAQTFDGDMFVGVFDPSVEADITADTTFVNASSYSKIVNLLNMEAGRWMGARWLRSNFLYTFSGLANNVASQTYTDVATGGTLVFNTGYFFVVTGVNATTGFEEVVYQQKTVTTANDAVSTHKVTIVVPSTTGYTYNIYAGSVTGTTYLVTSGLAPAASSDVTSIPTSGTTSPAAPATAVVVHTLWIFGKEAFASITLDGMSLQTYITPKQASDSDPLEQRRKVGWKLAFKGVICNNNFMRRIECATAY